MQKRRSSSAPERSRLNRSSASRSWQVKRRRVMIRWMPSSATTWRMWMADTPERYRNSSGGLIGSVKSFVYGQCSHVVGIWSSMWMANWSTICPHLLVLPRPSRPCRGIDQPPPGRAARLVPTAAEKHNQGQTLIRGRIRWKVCRVVHRSPHSRAVDHTIGQPIVGLLSARNEPESDGAGKQQTRRGSRKAQLCGCVTI